MVDEFHMQSPVKKWIPRVLKAVIWGALNFLVVYYLPTYFFPLQNLPFEHLVSSYHLFVGIVVFFAFISKLCSGTVLEYGFGTAKAVIMIGYLLVVFEGGVINLTLPFSETTVNLSVNLQAFLMMLITINFLSIAKNMLQITNLLTKKAEVTPL
jgi:hypothetical protein